MINDRLGLTASIPAAATPAAVLKTMGVDNKKTGDVIRYCLLEDIGRCANPEHDYLMRVDDEQVLEVLTRFRSEQGWADAAPPAEASRLVQ